jgi:glucose-6-phosphate isomerase
MLEVQAAYEARGLAFGRHAVAITGEGSELDRYASASQFVARFPMWDWVGGRTSELSAVGLVPAALQGLDVDGLLAGARAMDAATRRRDLAGNPASLLAAGWLRATEGRAARAMVVLPYKDRLELLGRYLQQLVMESLGKAKDLAGREVHQGLAVYGNKGSTDQHAYVQQLREGPDDFFAVFVRVLRDRQGPSMLVEPDVTSGDYLAGFLLGTRRALDEAGRLSTTITVPDAGARSLGALIALFERAVGFYATLVNVNAYHQPGVEAGKRAAADVIALQRRLLEALRTGGEPRDAAALAADAGTDDVETAHAILEHLAANPDRGVVATAAPGAAASPWDVRYRLV